jgi:hypothetical protein
MRQHINGKPVGVFSKEKYVEWMMNNGQKDRLLLELLSDDNWIDHYDGRIVTNYGLDKESDCYRVVRQGNVHKGTIIYEMKRDWLKWSWIADY